MGGLQSGAYCSLCKEEDGSSPSGCLSQEARQDLRLSRPIRIKPVGLKTYLEGTDRPDGTRKKASCGYGS